MDFNFDWYEIFDNLIYLGIVYLFVLFMVFDCEKISNGVGFWIFLLVVVVFCGYVLVGMFVLISFEVELKVLEGIIIGIGFIGGGVILKNKNLIYGIVIVVSIWNMGFIGIVVVFSCYEIVFLMVLINFVMLRYVKCLK